MTVVGSVPCWTEYITEDGLPYYHNSVTNKTQWSRPLNFPFGDPTGDTGGVEDAGRGGSGSEGLYASVTTDAMIGNPGRGGSFDASGDMAFDPVLAEPHSFVGGNLVKGAQTSSYDRDGAASTARTWTSCFGLCDLAYLRMFYDISTVEFLYRLACAIFPFKVMMTKPSDRASDFLGFADLYGPVWVGTTLTLFIFGGANVARWAVTGGPTNFGLLGVAATLVYGSILVIPLLASLLIRLLRSGNEDIPEEYVGLGGMICVYGYSLLPYVPASLLSMIPVTVIRWIAALVALLTGLAFTGGALIRSYESPMPKFRIALIVHGVTCHLAVFLTFRLYFFRND